MKHETLGPKIPEYHFQPDEWHEPSDPEFFEQFMAFVESKGFNPAELVFSGFDGTPYLAGEPMPRKKGIYAMNLAGWKHTLNQPGKNNPAMYADGHDVKAIGLYDSHQLSEAYLPSHSRKDPTDEGYEDLDKSTDFLEPVISTEQAYDSPSLDEVVVGGQRYEIPNDPTFRDDEFEIRDDDTSIRDALKGENLSDLPAGHVVEEGVLHRNYPEDPQASPTDALVGIVFYKPFEPPKRGRRVPQYRF